MTGSKLLEIENQAYRLIENQDYDAAIELYRELENAVNAAKAFIEFSKRVKVLTRIAIAVNKKVLAIGSGTDCDCVQWTRKAEFDTIEEFEKFAKGEFEYADGPMDWMLATTQEFSQASRESRDLIAEAYEDGHVHVVRP